MINIENVSFSYLGEQEILKNINLNIANGECVLLCGKSGCGKTTITKLINGLIPHFYEGCKLSGKVTVNDINVAESEMFEIAKTVGSVFQNPKSQFFHLDSTAELAFGLENVGTEQNKMLTAMDRTVNDLGIANLLDRNVFNMSGGEKQTLAFASVYSTQPSTFVLDEPTANLDQDAIKILREQIKRIKSQGKTIVIAEHRLWFVADLIDRAVFMENGEISNIYTKDEFLNLSDEDRVKMGLRGIKLNEVQTSCDIKTGDFVLDDLSLCIKNNNILNNLSLGASSGEIIGIIGSNGCGKTTLLKCICGLAKHTSGNISYKNKQLKPKQRNKLCYMIMQDVNYQLFSDSVFGECQMSDKTVSKQSILNVLDEFNMLDYTENHPMSLSGGQKQRIAIATGVLSSKKILLFDEPTSGLDYDNMVVVAKMLKKLSENGHIIIVVTHDNELLQLCADKILRM